jgi:hypothetical protein
MNKTQHGFAVLESLLILVIIAIIGGTGYYVWHSKQQTDKSLNDASTSSQSLGDAKSSSSHSNSGAKTSSKYVTISQWGVRAAYSGPLTLQYELTSSNGISEAGFTSKELVAKGGADCNGGAGAIIQYKGTDTIYDEAGVDSELVSQAAVDGKIGKFTKAGNYFYMFRSVQAPCADPSVIGNLQIDTINAVRTLTANLQTIPQ